MRVRERSPGRHRAFGVTLEADVRWPGWPPCADAGPPDARLEHVDAGVLGARWSGDGETLWATEVDGAGRSSVARGAARDHLVTREGAPALWISPDAGVVLATNADPGDPHWARFVLDTGLLVLAVLRGAEALHAAAVAIDEGDGGCVALLGAAGAGKTSVAAELVAGGGRLLCDDVLVVSESAGGASLGHAAAPVMSVPLAWRGDRSALGDELARFGDEAWLAVEPGPAEAPLRAIVFLDRRPGAGLALQPRPATVVDLLDHGIGLDFSPERQRSRFETLSAVAATVPAYTLRADLAVPAARLAPLARSAASPAQAPA